MGFPSGWTDPWRDEDYWPKPLERSLMTELLTRATVKQWLADTNSRIVPAQAELARFRAVMDDWLRQEEEIKELREAVINSKGYRAR